MSDPARTVDIAASLESVLSTGELRARPSRPPDYETENRALLAIAQHMADSPGTVLQKLVEVALEACRAGSAGVSLLSEESGDFYWPAIAGAWRPHVGGGTPRHFGPCGVVLDRDAAQLFTHPELYYPYLVPVSPPIAEALLTPFYVEGKATGTVWAIAHDSARKFDAEDMRLMESLGRFAAAAYPLRAALDTRELQSRALRDFNEALLVSSVRQHELTAQAQTAEAALRETEERLELELAATQRLQEASTELIREEKGDALYQHILAAAAAVMHSDMATMQILDEGEDALRLLAFRVFEAEFARIFELVRPDAETSCGAARREGQRVVVPDVETCGFMAGTAALEDLRKAGVRAVQSTPLISRGGRLLGMISTHWRNPHQPAPRDLRLLDVLARQAADLMERSRAESALRESEERYRTLVSVITDVPWTTDPEGCFVGDQPAWAAYTGQAWDEMRGFGWANAVHPDDRSTVRELWERARQARATYRSQGRLWHAVTEQYRYFEARATPLFNEDGGVREWVGSCTDVDEQRRAEAALRSLNADLKHFSYAASHDLQEPLRMVMSFTQLLAREYSGRLDPQADRFIAYAVEGAQRMEALLRDLREYWSMNERGLESLGLVDCDRVLDTALADLEVSIQESGAVVTRDALPAVVAEELPLTLLFQNLVGNAVKYRRPEKPRIHVSAQRDGAAWRLSVSDNGIGIQPEYSATIFAPFKRLHGREYPGTGIGLAICQKIVERYGGRIWVESTYGQGSTFHFTVAIPGGDPSKPAAIAPLRRGDDC